MPSAIAEKIAAEILDDVIDRRGWQQEWDGFDKGVQQEIVDKWIEIIDNRLNAENRPSQDIPE
jgi:hypothetical protein